MYHFKDMSGSSGRSTGNHGCRGRGSGQGHQRHNQSSGSRGFSGTPADLQSTASLSGNHGCRGRGSGQGHQRHNQSSGSRGFSGIPADLQSTAFLSDVLMCLDKGTSTKEKNPRPVQCGFYRERARSEQRAGKGMKLEVHGPSDKQHNRKPSGTQSLKPHTHSVRTGTSTMEKNPKPVQTGSRKERAYSENRAGKGMKLEVHGPSDRQHNRKQSGTQSSNQQSHSARTVPAYPGAYQPRNIAFATKARSMQNLMELSAHANTTKNDSCYELKPDGTNKAKASCAEKKLDYRTISRLSLLEPSEVLMQLVAPKSGLNEFLNEGNMSFSAVEGFLKLLKTAIRCTSSHQNLIHLLNQVHGSVFLKQILPYHIMEFSRTVTQQNKTFSFIENTFILLNELVSIFPSSSFTEVTIVNTLLESVLNGLQKSGEAVPADVQHKMESLQTLLQHLQVKKQDGTLRSDNSIYIVGNREDISDDFRSLSIYPTYKDIYLDEKIYMPQNIVDGSYRDAKSYLDTHFRLLREDFIRPLRDGISQLVSVHSKEIAVTKFNDIRIYFNAQILSPVCTRVGIVHEVKFDISKLSNVHWESSRRLLFGALVCLSKDNFRNMFFATVADRSVSDLQKGVITLMFCEESRQALESYTVSDTFLMVEATAYFEAYRHVLEGLKEMVDTEIPFQKYIVHCNTAIHAPLYLAQNRTGYSLECLKNPNSTQKQGFVNMYSPMYSNQFDVLNFNTWPRKEELGLDESQFEAIKMSLTRELSIVQGPPGTGKTYVGLKIVHTLLANSDLWKTGKNPILIVCFTNHALDQFLEGILKYKACNIVRVGSRSSSEILQNCSLSKIRSKKSNANLPGYMRAMHAELSNERRNVQKILMEKACLLLSATKGVLHENTLENYIPCHHFSSLMSQKACIADPLSSSPRTSSVIVEWLGISLVHRDVKQTIEDLVNWEREALMDESDSVNTRAYQEDDDKDFIKINEEAELAEAERMIDEEDDIKQQLIIARKRAAQVKNEILAFDPEEQDSDDQCTDQEEWEIPSDMKKKLKKLMKYELEKTDHMDERACNEIQNLWLVPLRKRWEIYRWWRSKYLTDIRNQIFTHENMYQIVINRMGELRTHEDLLTLGDADIIGMTTTGAAKYRRLLQSIQPKIVVVEEAAEVLEAHILTSISSGCQHLILIGDHQQLRPSTTVYDLAITFNLDVSMFERLVRMNVPYVRLNYQHRMRPEIATLLTPNIYDKLENHESVKHFENIKGVGSSLFFIDHNHQEDHIKEGKSYQNSHEAVFVKCLCSYLLNQGYNPSQITILTTYSGQLHCLQKLMPKSKFQGVRVCVVDKYQGEENDIIILSLVRSNERGNVGFLKIPNRVCVALSRAKKGLFCVGNMQLLSSVPLWSKINDVLKANRQLGSQLPLYCQNHPEKVTYVSKAEDFTAVPEGGCMYPCDFRLPCGHVCTLNCHPYDSEHKDYVCNKPCHKVICENGHTCKNKCSEPCGKCKQPVPKQIEKCGHIQDIPCSQSADTFVCKVHCAQFLQCGHKCVRWCGQTCTINCPEKVIVTLECGHTMKTLCHLKSKAEKDGTKIRCSVRCEEKLSCGHLCPGSCSSCLEQGFHHSCNNSCDIILLCSHRCEEKCAAGCFCIRACEKKCFHGKCTSKCSDPCTPCTMLCGWCCAHEKCTKLCWEPCDREPCNEPCNKSLKCKHPCIGLCGEPCPQKCRICDAEEVTELFFGKEDDPDARFVKLMDCPHFFEVTKFSEWMNLTEQDQEIKLKSCPKCSRTIRQSLRFGNLIKQTLSDIETVKEKIASKWLNHLEMFLSEKEDMLKHFPAASQVMQQMQEGQISLHSLMQLNEKIQLWLKLGAIKNKLDEVPSLQSVVDGSIASISKKIMNSTKKYEIFQNEYELYRLALHVESFLVNSNVPDDCIKNIQDLYKQMSKEYALSLDVVKAQVKQIPVQLQLISQIEAQKSALDTELLRLGKWYKCSAGHIYTNIKPKMSKMICPQCDSNNCSAYDYYDSDNSDD
ncbi:hypothetical protein XENTR_v10016478 [Xenopus tropicalis]|uniref:NFX1-type zinc finger-containing protein 1 isoform X1 n=1 Tax=Xenopus tropicalis TaxID=8364 RepID=A0A6I8RT93_XENTR|nr:NFX1-type zinc finger-containing protein 1 isoform X1 [Xenopus tropicalis]KAE8597455.1 hypothetical protein XENTR_v10016478 [Xenopus tropicalis]